MRKNFLMWNLKSTNYETKQWLGYSLGTDTFHNIIYMGKYGLLPNNKFTNELNKMVCRKLMAAYTNSLPVHVCSAAQSHLTLCDPMDCSPSGFSVQGIVQVSILEGAAISYSRGSSRLRHQTRVCHVSYIAGGFFTTHIHSFYSVINRTVLVKVTLYYLKRLTQSLL